MLPLRQRVNPFLFNPLLNHLFMVIKWEMTLSYDGYLVTLICIYSAV
jgi:hypothetical protein